MEFNEIARSIEQLTPLQIGVIVAALIFLMIGLRLVLRTPPSHLTAFAGEAGNVLVSRKALQALIKQACLLDDWVETARPVVRVRGRKVSSRVEVRLSAPDNLKEVCERLQGRVTALLQKSLSFDQIGEIQIIVKGFTASDETKPSALPEEETAASPAPKESSLTPRRQATPVRENKPLPPTPPPAASEAASSSPRPPPEPPAGGSEPSQREP